MKTVYEFEVHGGLRVPVIYCFDCILDSAVNAHGIIKTGD